MNSLDLIDRLSLDVRPVRAGGPGRDLATAAGAGALGALALVLSGYGVQPGLAAGVSLAAFAMKLAYVGMLGGIAATLVRALARPGVAVPSWMWLLLPTAALALFAMLALARTPVAAWPALLLGGSWTRCPWRIAALSLPATAALILALRRAAPTAPRRAGAAAGLVAGTIAAAAYALACTESSPAFVLIWYSLGLAISTGLGALAGPRLLRW